MRKLFLASIVFISASTSGQQMQNWHEIAGDAWTSIRVDKTIYKSDHVPCFFVHVQIRNKTPKPIGFVFTGRNDIVKPNQWGFYATGARDVIDEMTPDFPALTEKEKLVIVQKMKSGRLQVVRAGKHSDYFVMFNRSTPEDLQKKAAGYLIVTFVGRLHFTDGKRVVSSSLNRREVPIRLPVTIKPIPRGATVVEDQCTPSVGSATHGGS